MLHVFENSISTNPATMYRLVDLDDDSGHIDWITYNDVETRSVQLHRVLAFKASMMGIQSYNVFTWRDNSPVLLATTEY